MVPMNHSQPRSSMAPPDWSGDLSIQVAPTDVRISDVASGCDSQPEHPADPAAASQHRPTMEGLCFLLAVEGKYC